MRKLFLILFLGVLLSANAQWSVSLRNGVSVSNVSGETNYIEPMNLVEYNLELGVGYVFNKISLNSGISSSQLGFVDEVQLNDEFGNDMGIAEITYKYSYLSIPTFLTYEFSNGKLYFSPALGMSMNFLQHATYSVPNFDDYEIATAESFMPSLIFGAYVGYNITEKWSADICYRYNLGLSDFDTNEVMFNDKKLISSVFLLSLNYKF